MTVLRWTEVVGEQGRRARKRRRDVCTLSAAVGRPPEHALAQLRVSTCGSHHTRGPRQGRPRTAVLQGRPQARSACKCFEAPDAILAPATSLPAPQARPFVRDSGSVAVRCACVCVHVGAGRACMCALMRVCAYACVRLCMCACVQVLS